MMHAAQGAPASTIDLSRIPLDDLILLHALKSKQDEPATLVELSPQLREPHDEQRRFLDSPAKRKVIRAGRRGGKTTGVAILAARAFAAGRRVLYGCPTQDQTDKFWYEVCTIFAADIARGTLIKNETRRMIERRGTEQRLRCKTCFNADTLRGDYCDQLILDEYQLMHEDAWQQVGAPMLLDNDGDACFIYTPPSRRTRHLSRADDPRHASKLYAQAEAHQAAGGERWAAFHFTSHACCKRSTRRKSTTSRVRSGRASCSTTRASSRYPSCAASSWASTRQEARPATRAGSSSAASQQTVTATYSTTGRSRGHRTPGRPKLSRRFTAGSATGSSQK
jgi:hypothetical protein